jgi:hypothetical protein
MKNALCDAAPTQAVTVTRMLETYSLSSLMSQDARRFPMRPSLAQHLRFAIVRLLQSLPCGEVWEILIYPMKDLSTGGTLLRNLAVRLFS